MNIHQWRRQIRRFNESFEKDSPLAKQWNANTKANLPRFNHGNSIWNLEFKYYGDNEKGVILVGSSPCLQHDVDKLKKINEDFIIICANSALKFLLRHGVRPNYCICLDSDDVDIPQHLDCDNSDITLLSSSVVSPKSLDKWKGPIYYSPYYSIDKKLKPKLHARLGKKIQCGGNSITQGFITASVIMGSRTIIFVANEYCFDKRYYADKKAAKQEVLSTMYPVIDVKGRQRWTLPALYNYAIWTEKACSDLSPPGFFIDTSFGLLGKDTKAIHVMELSKAIEVVGAALKISKKLRDTEKYSERLKIIKGITPKYEQSEVYRYDMQAQRPELLRLARS